MITKELVDESINIHRLVDYGDFDLAYQQSVIFLEKLEKIKVKGDNYFIVLGNVAGGLVDIGQMSKHKKAAELGVHDGRTTYVALGPKVDLLLRKYSIGDMARVVTLQACAAAMLEEYLDEWQSRPWYEQIIQWVLRLFAPIL